MIRVTLYTGGVGHEGFTNHTTHEYPGHYDAKIVHGGALRIEEPEAFDVPELGQDKDKQIGKKDAKPIAIFSGTYKVEYFYDPEHD